jgi:cytochrome c2
VSLLGVLVLGGFSISRYSLGPFNTLADRIERKWGEVSGQPSELARRYSLIETTNVRLVGRVYDVPRQEYSAGGAMAPWGDDLLVMHRRGTIRRLVEGKGFFPTSIATPDNGLADYERISRLEEFSKFHHRPSRMRYNDLKVVDTAGLHGLALSYSFFDADKMCYGSRVAWLDVPPNAVPATFEAAPSDWRILFETSPCLELNPTWTAFDGMMAGGRMAVDDNGILYFGSGEYHLDGVHTYDVGIQSPDTDYGKVIAIDLATGEARHYSIGHRNMQGVAIDTQGRLWTTEHMIRGGDELNLIKEGENYGWPLETYGTLYSGLPFPNQGEDGRHVLHQSPAYAWMPSAAVSSLTAIDGFHPTWDGDLLAGSLSGAEQGQSLFRIHVEDDKVIFAERIRLGGRIRYVTQWGPDRIAVMIDYANVVVVFRAEERVDVLTQALDAIEGDLEPDVFAQVEQAARGCNECHSFERDVQMAGPSLAGVVGRSIGESFYPNYSDALASHGGTWDAKALRAYIAAPSEFAPGTSMPEQGLEPGPVVDGVVKLLEAVGATSGTDMGYN